MARIEAVAFSVTVDNEDELKAWLDRIMAARNLVDEAINKVVTLADEAPLLRMTLHRTQENPDG